LQFVRIRYSTIDENQGTCAAAQAVLAPIHRIRALFERDLRNAASNIAPISSAKVWRTSALQALATLKEIAEER
jgi:hypothetical protein